MQMLSNIAVKCGNGLLNYPSPTMVNHFNLLSSPRQTIERGHMGRECSDWSMVNQDCQEIRTHLSQKHSKSNADQSMRSQSLQGQFCLLRLLFWEVV